MDRKGARSTKEREVLEKPAELSLAGTIRKNTVETIQTISGGRVYRIGFALNELDVF